MSNTAESRTEAAVAEMARPVLRYLERYVGDPALARDLQQETLMRIARGYGNFDGRSALKTWAFAIASRVAADHFRAPERRLRIVELDEAAEVPAPQAPADAALVVDEMSACVREVIDSLPDTYRAALILHDLEGLSVEQTAEASECTVATAKIRIHRARSRLREALRRECAFHHDEDGVFRCDRRPPASGSA